MAQNAHGTFLNVTINSTLTPIAEITNIDGIEISADDIDVTSHDSEGWREFVQGLKDAGEVSIEGNFNGDNSQAGLLALLKTGESVAMQIAFPEDVATWYFNGYVKGLSTGAPMDDKIAFAATIKVTGQPYLLIGS